MLLLWVICTYVGVMLSLSSSNQPAEKSAHDNQLPEPKPNSVFPPRHILSQNMMWLDDVVVISTRRTPLFGGRSEASQKEKALQNDKYKALLSCDTKRYSITLPEPQNFDVPTSLIAPLSSSFGLYLFAQAPC